jgi:hypothetical protein
MYVPFWDKLLFICSIRNVEISMDYLVKEFPEINYYSSTMRHFVPHCCFYCGDTEHLIEDVDEYIQNLLEHFSVVRHICIKL